MLILQLFHKNVLIYQVAIDIHDCNQYLEDSAGPYVGFPLVLNYYAMYPADFVVVYTVLDLVVVVKHLRIIEPELPYIVHIIEGYTCSLTIQLSEL